MQGPADLYEGDPLDLVVSYMCTRGTDVNWPDIAARCDRALFYRAGFALLRMSRPGRRLLGIKRWRHAAEVMRELPWRIPVLRYPSDAPRSIRAPTTRHVCEVVAKDCCWRRDVALTFISRHMNMQAVARDARLEDLAKAHPARAAAAAAGADLIRVKYYWRLPILRSPAEVWRSTAGARFVAAERAAALMLFAPRPDPPEAYQVYVRNLTLPGPSQVLIAEDKDRAAAWIGDRWAYQWRCLQCLAGDGSWTVRPMTRAEAAASLAAAFSGDALRGIWPRTSQARWMEGLPMLYCTQIAKCWSTGMRTCSRPGHVCMRRISSWMRFPGRGVLQRIGRAWRLALLQLGHGVATASMSGAARDLRTRSRALECPPQWKRVCARCSAPKHAQCTNECQQTKSHAQRMWLRRSCANEAYAGWLYDTGRDLRGACSARGACPSAGGLTCPSMR